MAQTLLRNVWNITGYLLRTKLSLADFYVEIFNVDRSKFVIFHQAWRNHDSIVHVVATPWHESYQQIFTEGQLAVIDWSTFNQDVALLYFLATYYLDALVVTTIVVSFLKVFNFVFFFAIFVFNNYVHAVSFYYFTGTFSNDHLRSIHCNHVLNTSTYSWRIIL